MIIWRGFGFLAVILGALGFLAGTGLSSLVSSDGELNGAMVGLGLLLAGAATFALGWYLNVINPAKKAQTWVEQRRAELNHAVASGRFQASPGVVPASLAEAQLQADMMLDQESTAVTRRLSNIHTLFWIPMQWWGLVLALVGVVVAVLLLAG